MRFLAARLEPVLGVRRGRDLSRFARKLQGISILEALAEPSLLGSALVGDIQSWSSWLAFLACFFGLPLSQDQIALFRQCTARTTIPTAPFSTVFAVCGRGAGKSFMLCLIATYLACFRDWGRALAPGGKPIVRRIALPWLFLTGRKPY